MQQDKHLHHLSPFLPMSTRADAALAQLPEDGGRALASCRGSCHAVSRTLTLQRHAWSLHRARPFTRRLRESMGIAADASNKAFNSADIKAFFEREPVTIHRDLLYEEDASNTNHVIVAVDPAGGGNSAFAVCSIAFTPLGRIVVRQPVHRVASCPGALQATSLPAQDSAARRRRGPGTDWR